MMGAEARRSAREDHERAGEPLLTAGALQIRPGSRELDLALRPGEILALAGPVGGGREEPGLILAGQRAPASGQVAGPDRIGQVPCYRHGSGYVGLLGGARTWRWGGST